MRRAQRLAFTLVEMLVIIAIIGVLVGLLLPSVQASRETARATSCKNNLLNLHLAVDSYEASFHVYPVGTMTDRLPAGMFPDGKDHGWLVQTRSFFDGGFRFAEQWSPVHSVYHPRNWLHRDKAPPVVNCPSNPMLHDDGVIPLCYAGIHDGVDAPIHTTSKGFFVANRFLGRDDISDGLSHTLQLGEILVEPGDTFFWIAGNQSTLRTTGLPPRFPSRGSWWGGAGETRTGIPYGFYSDPPVITRSMIESAVAKSPDADISQLLIELDVGLPSNQANSGAVAPAPSYTLPKIGADATKALPLGSSHQGFLHGVFADGRVVAIHRSIDEKLSREMGIRNDSLPMEQPLVQLP